MNTLNTKEKEHILERLKTAKNIVIIPHVNADGDAIGSCLAMYLFLKKNNYNVRVICPNEYPDFLKWLPGSGEVMVFEDDIYLALDVIGKADILFYFDFNGAGRLGKIEEYYHNFTMHKIMLDHHPDPEPIADFIISYPQVSSTSELCYYLIKTVAGSEAIDKDMATCIYTGIMTDTGSLSYNSNSPEMFYTVADLVKKGINREEIFGRVFNNFSANRMRLLGFALKSRLKVIPELQMAYIYLSKKDLDDHEFINGDTEGFVNYPLSIKGIFISALITEMEDKVKMSFRSRGDFPVNDFSEKFFNGGGHFNAAGGSSEVSLSETCGRFEQKFSEYFQSFKEGKLHVKQNN